MTPYDHALSTAEKHGGTANDYIAIHDWFDCTKQYTGDWTHRMLRHHAAGIQWAIEKFGHSILNCNGKAIPVKVIAEQHVKEDCGFIPTVQEWTSVLAKNPRDWMLKVQTKRTEALQVKDE